MTFRQIVSALLVLAFLGCFSGSLAAEEIPVRLGVRGGGNYNILTRPEDPVGEPTLASGAGFVGLGFTGGIAAMYPLTNARGPGQWGLELDILFSSHSGTATVEVQAEQQSRKIKIGTSMLRVPVLLGYTHRMGNLGFRGAMGPELLLGLSSDATVSQTNVSTEPTPLFTMPVTRFGITAAVAVEYRLPAWLVPLEFRFTWDPMVPKTTVERFDAFQNSSSPGKFQVGFDYQFFVMLGLDRVFVLD